MLIRRTIPALLLLITVFVLAPAPSQAAGTCDTQVNPWCTVDSGGGGTAGGGGGTGGGCRWNGVPVLCQDPDYGSYIGGGCYVQVANPAPFPPLPGHSTGGWYTQTCYTTPGSSVVTQAARWIDNPPSGPTPAQLAQQALARIHLFGAQIGVAPQPGGAGAVGLPVWLWTAVTPGTWGPLTASASGGGITVTIAARAHAIIWDMGDGHQVTCTSPGTSYQASFGLAQSPTCPYVYAKPSHTSAHPHGRYTVTATTQWTVTWTGGGQSGVLNPTSSSQTSVEIGEIQVVTQ